MAGTERERAGPFLRLLLYTATLLGSAACTCSEEPSERPRGAPSGAPGEGAGGDDGLFPPVGDPASAPSAERFEPIDVALGREMARARSWAGSHRLREGDDGRGDVGNWLCRLVALYGPAPGVEDDGFRYVFRDAVSERVIVAYADASGPAMGAVITAPEGWRLGDEDRTAAAVDAFVALVDATRPQDCTLEVGGRTIGMRGGRPL